MLIVCPLEYERSALARAAARHGWQLECSGPAAEAMRVWAARAAPRPGELVVLAGLAAGLTSQAQAGEARIANTVVEARGATYHAPFLPPQLPHARMVTVGQLLTTAEAKRQLAHATGATHADMEGAAFAGAAHARGWRWAVVRGVSDGADQAMSARIAHWTDAAGRTRPGTVALGLLAAHALLPGVIRLGRQSAAAMRSVLALLEQLARLEADTKPASAVTMRAWSKDPR